MSIEYNEIKPLEGGNCVEPVSPTIEVDPLNKPHKMNLQAEVTRDDAVRFKKICRVKGIKGNQLVRFMIKFCITQEGAEFLTKYKREIRDS